MNITDGRLYTEEEVKKKDEKFREFLIPVDPNALTAKQKKKKRVSMFDNRSYAGQLRVKNKIGRNDPCPCKSGKKYKKCCLGKMG